MGKRIYRALQAGDSAEIAAWLNAMARENGHDTNMQVVTVTAGTAPGYLVVVNRWEADDEDDAAESR